MNERTIWKFTIALTDEPSVQMPEGAEVIHFDNQDGTPTIWAVVDPDAPLEVRHFSLRGTGHRMNGAGRHIGTAFQGPFVWHLFEPTEAATPSGSERA